MLRIYSGRNGHLTPVENLKEPSAVGVLWLDLLNPTRRAGSTQLTVRSSRRILKSKFPRATKWRKSSCRTGSSTKTARNS